MIKFEVEKGNNKQNGKSTTNKLVLRNHLQTDKPLNILIERRKFPLATIAFQGQVNFISIKELRILGSLHKKKIFVAK